MAKFCIKCGRPLVEGEVCECQKTVAEPVAKGTGSKDFWAKTGDAAAKIKSFRDKTVVFLKKVLGFVLKYWYAFLVRIGVVEPENVGSNIYERGMKIVPECIKADEGEIPIRQYTVAKLRRISRLNWAEGRLQVTNKRIIFRAPGIAIMGKTLLQHEFSLDEIAGIEARKEQKFSFFDWWIAVICASFFARIAEKILISLYEGGETFACVMAVLALISGIVPMFTVHKKFLLKVMTMGVSVGALTMMINYAEELRIFAIYATIPVVVLWTICSLLYCIKPNLVIVIKTKGASGAIEIRKRKSKGIFAGLVANSSSEAEEYTGFSKVFPMKDTEKAIREVGAIISDIQKLGDYGIDKWKEE